MRESAKDFIAIMNKFRLLGKKINNSMELSSAEFCVILAIVECTKRKQIEKEAESGVTISEMAAEMGSSMPAASKLLRSMEEKELVERVESKTDRRVTYIKVSPKGLETFNMEKKKQKLIMEKIICSMGEENMKVLLTQLQNLYKYTLQEMEAQKKYD